MGLGPGVGTGLPDRPGLSRYITNSRGSPTRYIPGNVGTGGRDARDSTGYKSYCILVV